MPVTPGGPASVPVPLYGQIAAGPQNLTERIKGDTWDLPVGDTWDLPRELVGDGALFRLRVRGVSTGRPGQPGRSRTRSGYLGYAVVVSVAAPETG